MIMIILSILLLNFFTCFLTRICQGGKFVVKNSFCSKLAESRNIFISGFMMQPEETYRYFESVKNNNCIYLAYSLFGYNPVNAGAQLNRMLTNNDVVYSASVGCKAAIFAKRNEVKNILFNPIVQITATNPDQISIQMHGASVLRILSYALGWVTVLPLIKMKAGQKGSIALFCDQKYWSYYGNPGYDDIGNAYRVGVIVNDDEVVLGSYVALLINRGAIIKAVKADRLSSMHPKDSTTYERVAADILANLF